MTVVCSKCEATASGSPAKLPEGWKSRPSSMTDAVFLVCGSCSPDTPSASSGTADHAADQLRLLIERIERVEEEIHGAMMDRKDIYLEAKATGYDVKTMKQIVRLRKMDKASMQEAEALLETYKASLGMS